MQAPWYADSLDSMDEPFPGHWLHGFLDLALLSLLAEQRDYGYGLAQRLTAAGLGEVPGGTIYPALLRLERQGFAAAAWEASQSGPRRKCYELTNAGRAQLAGLAGQWDDFSASVSRLTQSERGRSR